MINLPKHSPYGLLPARESGWRARLRFHAAWFHRTILEPNRDYGREASGAYANCLSPELASAGKNFVSNEAWSRYQIRRTEGWGVEPERCTSNLLSSQALTLNLFGTLAEHPIWHARVLGRVLGWSPGEVTDTRIEYAPAYPSQHFGDKTRIDALVDWQGDSGRRLVAVEVKFADRYVSRVIDICDNQAYRKFWAQSQRWDNVDNTPRINQFFRIHGLAESISISEEVERSIWSPHFLLIHHDMDPVAHRVIEEYRATLNKEHRISATSLPLSTFIRTMAELAQSDMQREVCALLELRYVSLHRSESAWSSFKNNEMICR